MLKSKQKTEAGEQQMLFKTSKRKLPAAERVKMLQEKLYCKAKQERSYKFYILYDKMFIPYMLQEAYNRVKANAGSPGIDGQTFSDIERYGLEKFLFELGEDLRKRTYKPQAVKRLWIEKANGGKRPLGIPTIRDRVAQTVCKMLIEPIFEADFEENSYGFRPERSSKDAMKAIKEYLKEGKTEVIDADLSSYFDTIPHDKLMKVLEIRIADSRILHLITLWLKSPIYEDGKFEGGKKRKTGTPQGGVISPLLANIYMHLVDRIVKTNKIFKEAGIKMVRYADDFVILGEQITVEAKEKLQSTIARMGLMLNEQKTRYIQARDTSFNFLGFTVRYDRDIHGHKKKYWNIIPSKESENKVKEKLRTFLTQHRNYNPERVAKGLNTILRGWLNYFEIDKVSYPAKSKRAIRNSMIDSLYRYYKRKSQRHGKLNGTQIFDRLVREYSLIDPTTYRVNNKLR